MNVPLYLMWQTFGNGTKHLRRIYFVKSFCLEVATGHQFDAGMYFDGWEPQTEQALAYMEKIGNPEFSDHPNLPVFITGKLPYEMKELP